MPRPLLGWITHTQKEKQRENKSRGETRREERMTRAQERGGAEKSI